MHYFDQMARCFFDCRILQFIGEFNFAGYREAPQSIRRSAGHRAAFFMLVGLALPSAALPQIGPTSSASLGIAVSVAPKYELRTNKPRTALKSATAGFCISTNGKPAHLPVLLIRQRADARTRPEAAAKIEWCAANGPNEKLISERGERVLLIVSPD